MRRQGGGGCIPTGMWPFSTQLYSDGVFFGDEVLGIGTRPVVFDSAEPPPFDVLATSHISDDHCSVRSRSFLGLPSSLIPRPTPSPPPLR